MTKTKILLLIAASVLAASCTPADVPPPAVTPQGEDRLLVNPLEGWDAAVAPDTATRFDAAWRWALGGNETEARRRLGEILAKDPQFLPATLAGAAIDIRAGNLDEAARTVAAVLERKSDYRAALIYEAEIAARSGQVRRAVELYRALAPATAEHQDRLEALTTAVFNELIASAQTSTNEEAVRLFREALTFRPDALEPRIQLAQRLVAAKQFDEARRELDPVLNTAADRSEVQEMLAEIDVGRGRYQEAIVRYDRLAKRTKDSRFERRLEEIKQEWSAANMPSHFRSALDSTAITRAQLATLLYWTVPSVRFAQNLSSPPIALDIENVEEREEIIRAIAIGLFDVDGVTRRVSPFRAVPASRFSAHLGRVLTLRGAPCAKGVHADRVLAACGVTDPLATLPPDSPVTGREAVRALQQVAKALQ
ncbi:MAG TPA: tetratricopeptide repeat protein [Thermoanaerobaculia bacterium]|nr:tetratricopeptide repeat protein [Thermoanaerobaculia bacterium]